jgi:Type VI secretion system/phage-baseplate injector OB domain
MSKVSVELLRGPEDEEEPRKIFGVVTAKVGPLPDPLMQGRVQVILPFLDDCDMAAFARVATPFTGMLSGSYFVPMPGDEVLVAFEHGDVNCPFIIGALWNLKALPPVPSQLTTIKTIRNQTGSQIVFSDLPTTSVTIQAAGATAVPAVPAAAANIIVTPGVVQIVCGTTSLNITPAGILMQSGAHSLTLSEAGVTIQSTSAVIVQATSIFLNA